jgi:iron complex transport system substrate-binding protein
MRIVSLLPSATEIVFALGLGDALAGVTHECDWPPAARSKPVVSRTTLPPGASPAEVDQLVSASVEGGQPVYRLDGELIRRLDPDLVITQDLCAVCAVPSGHVQEALDLLGSPASVLSLDPGSLAEIIDSVVTVARATGTEERGAAVAGRLRERLERVRSLVAGRDRPRVLALEWGDPPFDAGHWVPEMIEAAGGICVWGVAGRPSVRRTWQEIAATAADVAVFMPCGYGLEAACAEGRSLLARPELAGVPAVFAADGSALFSRPGPRVVDGVEALAAALHPELAGQLPRTGVRRLR